MTQSSEYSEQLVEVTSLHAIRPTSVPRLLQIFCADGTERVGAGLRGFTQMLQTSESHGISVLNTTTELVVGRFSVEIYGTTQIT